MQHKPGLRQSAEFRKLQKLKISHRLWKNLNSQCRIFSAKAPLCPPSDETFPEVDERDIFISWSFALWCVWKPLVPPKPPRDPTALSPTPQSPWGQFSGLALTGWVCWGFELCCECPAVPAMPPAGPSQGLRIHIAFGQEEKKHTRSLLLSLQGRVFLVLASPFSSVLEPFVFLCSHSFKQCQAHRVWSGRILHPANHVLYS